jgi:hypothetical protein
MKKHYRIAPKVREQVFKRIKAEWVSVSRAAPDAGIHETTAYGRLANLSLAN